MRTDITHALPPVVADHIAAYNTHNPDALMATFAADALLNDARREFLGLDAIRAWADKEIFGDNVTLVVERALEQHGNIVLHARADGDFDKTTLPDPLVLTYYFSIWDGKITQLIITFNSIIA